MTDEIEHNSNDYQQLIRAGLWKNNPVLVQVLGLCPLLAVSSSVVKALGLGLATLIVITLSNAITSMMRQHITKAILLPALLIVIASLVTCIELLMKAYAYELYQILGIFIPLIVGNFLILSRAETFAMKNRVIPAALDGFMMGLGFLFIFIFVGAIREILGTGMLFDDMQLLLGGTSATWTLTILDQNYPGIMLAILPPGALILLGFIIAGKNFVSSRSQNKRDEHRPAQEFVKGSKRVRTTGPVA